jgi:molybdopterin-synthase adenylyltransferase
MRADPWYGMLRSPTGVAIVRIDATTWATMSAEIRDFTVRERAGVLFVRAEPSTSGILVTSVDWMPVPDEYVIDSRHGLIYDGRFHLRVAERAESFGFGALLVHAHSGHGQPMPSRTDADRGAAFVAFMRRRVPKASHGLLVVGAEAVTGVIDESAGSRLIGKLVSVGLPTVALPAEPAIELGLENEDRQQLAIGPIAQARLGAATVGVIGNSGGGSHVTQQLIHAGVGRLIVVDPDIVTVTNLRRLVGAVATDIDTTLKVDIARRTAVAVRPAVRVETYAEGFPSSATLAALREADVIVGCVDGWDTRDDLNTFALMNRIPYVDIGLAVSPPTNGLGMRVGGQIALTLPGEPCLRCTGLVTDARVEASRQLKRGYAAGVAEPQVVSLNGVLASEAVTSVLMLLAGDDRLEVRRRYAYPPGKLVPVMATRRAECVSCVGARL